MVLGRLLQARENFACGCPPGDGVEQPQLREDVAVGNACGLGWLVRLSGSRGVENT